MKTEYCRQLPQVSSLLSTRRALFRLADSMDVARDLFLRCDLRALLKFLAQNPELQFQRVHRSAKVWLSLVDHGHRLGSHCRRHWIESATVIPPVRNFCLPRILETAPRSDRQ